MTETAPRTATPGKGVTTTPTLDAIMAPVAEDLRRVEHALRDGIRSLAPQITEIGAQVFSGGGKRMRPALVLLSAQMCGYRGPRSIQIAAAAEHLHTATLLHDDVVDGADLRRGHKSVNARFGPRLSVLVGDFLYAMCCQMLVEDGSPDILAIFAESIRSMAEGEVLQLSSSFEPGITEARYYEVIDRKTAMLIASCTEAGAVLGNVTRSERRALREIGREMGLAFQLVDDALDYPAANVAMGKPPLADASEGKITLPLILTLKRCTAAERDEIGAVLKARVADRAGAAPSGLAWIADCVARHRGVEQTLARADVLVRRARQRIEPFADSEAKQSLIDLTEFIVRRRS
jgi:octaprenyl-diphosphate synthase